jgi:hypothetical protein
MYGVDAERVNVSLILQVSFPHCYSLLRLINLAFNIFLTLLFYYQFEHYLPSTVSEGNSVFTIEKNQKMQAAGCFEMLVLISGSTVSHPGRLLRLEVCTAVAKHYQYSGYAATYSGAWKSAIPARPDSVTSH